jgi:hypothetical protein
MPQKFRGHYLLLLTFTMLSINTERQGPHFGENRIFLQKHQCSAAGINDLITSYILYTYRFTFMLLPYFSKKIQDRQKQCIYMLFMRLPRPCSCFPQRPQTNFWIHFWAHKILDQFS